ncbi:MerR family transcriptional regulator [Peribacillus tepidiphilus]|uniref:MerR family transcriptional regulator n=1 Tax=Peribacillus tepidiphilus TaxID=2652445 RepID=UPI0035B52BD7
MDYYTQLGLLKPKRSTSNYRYYDLSDLERLQFIEQCKRKHMSLDEIKRLIKEQENEWISEELEKKLRDINVDIQTILNNWENLDDRQKLLIKSKLSADSLSLIQSLIMMLL